MRGSWSLSEGRERLLGLRRAVVVSSFLLLFVRFEAAAAWLVCCGRSGRVEEESNSWDSGRLLLVVLVLVLMLMPSSVLSVFLPLWEESTGVAALLPNRLSVNEFAIVIYGVWLMISRSRGCVFIPSEE